MIPLLTTLIAGTAQAAEVTELPPAMRGDIGIGYKATVVPDTLYEGDTEVGKRRSVAHQLTYHGTLGLTEILALELQLPHTVSSRLSFSESHRMAYDPNTGTGTMIGTDMLQTQPEISGSGLEGTRISLAVTPFSEAAFSERGDDITWLLRAGYQAADKTNIWTHTEGDRGAGQGASALVLQTAFSTTNGITQPYMALSYDKRLDLRTDIKSASGATVAKNLTITPASTVTVATGLEIEVYKDEAWADGLGTSVRLTPSARFGWRSGAEIPSGVSLPSVLSMTKNTIVGQGETSEIWAGMKASWRAIKYLDWDVHAEMGSPLSYEVEHPYNVSTGMGELGWSVGTALTFRMRDPLFDPPAQ